MSDRVTNTIRVPSQQPIDADVLVSAVKRATHLHGMARACDRTRHSDRRAVFAALKDMGRRR
jgi:hypothetical protein